MDPNAPKVAEKKDLLEDDSEDEDYLPPTEGKNTVDAASSIKGRKRAQGGIALDDDDEDDEDEDDDDEDNEDDDDYISDDADAVDAEVANASTNGAGPSSATGTGASSLDAPVVNEDKKENGAEEGEEEENDDNVKDEADDEPERKKARVEEPSEKIADTTGTEPVKNTVEGDSAGENKEKNDNMSSKPMSKIDALWAEMNAEAGVKPRPKANIPIKHDTKQSEKKPNKEVTSFSAGKFVLPNLDDLEKAAEAAKVAERKEKQAKKKSNATGLEGVLKIVRGEKSGGMVESTREKWKDFKQKEGVEDELEAHKKDKSRYTDRVAFLQRSDVREWEYEQAGKKGR